MSSISVIGAGAWGTALAHLMATKGLSTTLYARDETLAAAINTKHSNVRYLPAIKLHPSIKATATIEAALHGDALLLVPPAQALRATLLQLRPHMRPAQALILCSKGIESDTGKLMSEVAMDIIPQQPLAILTGPNFAHEIAALKPAASTLACADEALGARLQALIAAPSFRPYTTTDIIGAQIAGALKNVIAIACGMARGLNMGESAQASLVTRGMAEIVRLGLKMGARNETFLGLSGMGDLMLTCSSEKSRNFSLGYALGQGLAMAQIMAERRSVTEGIHTARAAIGLAKRYDVALPVCQAVHHCVNEGLSLQVALKEMLSRPLGHEVV